MNKVLRLFIDPKYTSYVLKTRSKRQIEKYRLNYFGIAPPPQMLILQITGICNLRCGMCNQWGEQGGYHGLKAEDITLSLEEISNILAQTSRFRPYVQLLGGEPLLHPNLDKILQLLQKHRLQASLETNGTLLEKWATRLNRSTVNTINLSIDGPENIHDEIRGKAGVFRKAMAGIKALEKAKIFSDKNLELNIRLTFHRKNQKHLLETIDLFRDLPVSNFVLQHQMFTHPKVMKENDEIINMIHPAHPKRAVNHTMKSPEIDGDVICHQIREILQPTRFPFNVHVNPCYPDSYIRQYYKDASALGDPSFVCKLPAETITITCTGIIGICSHFYVGNYKKSPSLLKNWNSHAARRFRKHLYKSGFIPACKICCYPTDSSEQ